MLSGTMSYTLLKCQIQNTVKHKIGFSRKILINVYLPYALKSEMKKIKPLKQTIAKSLSAYAAKKIHTDLKM